MVAIRKWKSPTEVQSFRLPHVCLRCIMDAMWDQIPPSLQEELLKKYDQLAEIGVSIHAVWCEKHAPTK